MLKRYLFSPGPTPVPPEVLLAMARPIIHHRAPNLPPSSVRSARTSNGSFKQEMMS